jgi:hypothetical protein
MFVCKVPSLTLFFSLSMRQMDSLHWNLVLSFVALIVNVFLCSSQIIVFINLGEYSQVGEMRTKKQAK